MCFLKTVSGYKKKKGRRIILRVSLGRQKKDEVVKPTDKTLIINLFVDNKCKYANEMCLSVFIKGFLQKLLVFLLSAVPILHLVCSFHNSDLIITFITDFEFLYLAESSQY